MERILSEIAKQVDSTVYDSSVIELVRKEYIPFEISDMNYNIVYPSSSDSEIIFIDGGNNEIIKASNFAVHLIRVCSTSFFGVDKKSVQVTEAYVFTRLETVDGELSFVSKVFPIKGALDIKDIIIKANDQRILLNGKMPEISSIAGHIRRICELAVGYSYSLNKTVDFIVFDGGLDVNLKEEKEYLSKLIKNSITNDVHIAGLVKTNRIFTKSGEDLLVLLDKRAPMNVEWYYEIPTKTSYYLNTYVVKLHKRSDYRFRLEYLKGKHDVEDLLTVLVENSKDQLFLGYPYGLILSDKKGRISNDEISYYRIKLEARMKDYPEVKKHFTTINAHDTLDRFN